MLMHTNTKALQSLTQKVRRLYSKHQLTPCLLCHRLTPQYGVCDPCSQHLPRLGPACPRCATPMTQAQYCGRCLTNPPVRHATISVFRYDYPANKLITQFKFHHQLQLSRFLAQQFVQHLNSYQQPRPQQLIPIPLHPQRLRQRGYNQATELAKVISRHLHIPINQHSLIRIKATQPQSELAYKERKHNLDAAFYCPHRPNADHIALIDDVLTSGHTADAAATALLQQGIKTIELWTIARTIRHYA